MNNLYYILLCKIVYIYMGWEKSNTSIFSLSMDCLNGYWYLNLTASNCCF